MTGVWIWVAPFREGLISRFASQRLERSSHERLVRPPGRSFLFYCVSDFSSSQLQQIEPFLYIFPLLPTPADRTLSLHLSPPPNSSRSNPFFTSYPSSQLQQIEPFLYIFPLLPTPADRTLPLHLTPPPNSSRSNPSFTSFRLPSSISLAVLFSHSHLQFSYSSRHPHIPVILPRPQKRQCP